MSGRARLAVHAILLVLLGSAVWFGGMAVDMAGCCPYESAVISSYDADFDVDARGTLRADERITVRFDPSDDRHGIYRWFDHRDPNAPYSRRVPRDLRVTRAGAEEPVSVLDDDRGRKTIVRIGSPDRIVQGEQTYEISYVIDDVLLPAGRGSRFYWNLIAPGWWMKTEKAHLAVHLPGPVSGEVRCHVGLRHSGGCSAGQHDGALVVELTDLARQQPVTIDAGLGTAVPPKQRHQLWPTRLDGILGTSDRGVVLPLLLALLAGTAGFALRWRTRESLPPMPLAPAPPEGIGPAQAAYILEERVGRTQFVATLMHAAERGASTFSRVGDAWTLGIKDEDVRRELDTVTRRTLGAMGATEREFTLERGDRKSGRRVHNGLSSCQEQAVDWARREHLFETGWSGGLRWALFLGPLLVAVVGALWNPFNQSVWALVPGLFALCCWPLVLPGAGTRRTPAGRELWSRIGGFRRTLSTPSAQDRFDFSGRKELYTAYLPWAVAFGCADEWAEKYSVEVGERPPPPSYWSGDPGGSSPSTMVASFDSTVGSALSSYEASISTSGGGSSGSSFTGGSSDGSSGGGGGGGGGGGSW